MCTLVHKGRRKQSVIVSPPEKLKTAGLRGSGNGRLRSKSNLPSHLRPTIHSRSDKESSPFTGWGSRAGLLRCHLCWNKGQAHRRKRLQPGKPDSYTQVERVPSWPRHTCADSCPPPWRFCFCLPLQTSLAFDGCCTQPAAVHFVVIAPEHLTGAESGTY